MLAALFCLGLAWWQGRPLLYAAAGLLALAFLASFLVHNRVNRRLQCFRTLAAINEEGIWRLQRNWQKLHRAGPVRQSRPAAALDDGTAADLDLLGYASLEQLLATPNTPAGKATLRDWLLNPAPPGTVRLRQGAVAELAPRIDFRDQLCLRGRLMGPGQEHYERFTNWAEEESWLHARPWLVWLSRLLTMLVLGLAALALGSSLGAIPIQGFPVFPALVAVLLVNMTLTFTVGIRVRNDVEQVAAGQEVFRAYAEMFGLVTDQPVTAPGLRQLQQRLSAGGRNAARQMRRLARWMPLADIRRWMFFILIEIATLWSFHLLWLFEGWQRSAGRHVRDWLSALGELEALVALATLHHDHPHWTFPELIESEAPRLAANGLAHPLLAPGVAIANDVDVGPPGSFLLVTGSNMSGKSTLLRAIGVNTVLAQMGGPVCASRMQLPPLTVATSMRIQDSLEQGVSYFLAELHRLKSIVDLADRREDRQQRPLLYLLDEILQGTNTRERQVAARHVIAHLLETRSIGAVSTHDLTLADTPELAAASVPVHFTESFRDGPEGPAMNFDYKLRPGIATSTNALALMELVGLRK